MPLIATSIVPNFRRVDMRWISFWVVVILLAGCGVATPTAQPTSATQQQTPAPTAVSVPTLAAASPPAPTSPSAAPATSSPVPAARPSATAAPRPKPTLQPKPPTAQPSEVPVMPPSDNARTVIEQHSLAFNVDRATISVLIDEEVAWPSSALGCPKPGMNYLDVISPGFRVVIEQGGRQYSYHAGRNGNFFLCDREK